MVNVAARRLVALKDLLCILRGLGGNWNIQCITTPMFAFDTVLLYVLYDFGPCLLFVLQNLQVYVSVYGGITGEFDNLIPSGPAEYQIVSHSL